MDDSEAVSLEQIRALLGGERGGTLRGAAAGRGVRLGGADVGAARVRQPGPGGQGSGAAVSGADDRVEPCAGDAPDRGAAEDRPCEGGRVSAHEISPRATPPAT